MKNRSLSLALILLSASVAFSQSAGAQGVSANVDTITQLTDNSLPAWRNVQRFSRHGRRHHHGGRSMIDVLWHLSKLDDVDIVVPVHAGLADQQSFVYFREYLIALRDRVLEQMIAGATIEEILERVTMEDFSDYGNYDSWLRANVISMWDWLYRYREPSQGLGEYQNAYPIGFPIGAAETGQP